ncbi:hypothetical protein Gotri_005795, partial [Gossypium trilobum]|nr:hypothetical protein [Gossypium trilobum]
MDAKMMFPWMRWMSRLHNRNCRSHTKMLSRSIASEKVLQESAQKLYTVLCEIEGLTENEHYRTLSKIPDHPTQMLIFSVYLLLC